MKNVLTFSFAAILMALLFLNTGCNSKEELESIETRVKDQSIGVKSGSECAGYYPTDLDLSAGFLGTISHQMTGPAMATQIDDHMGVYELESIFQPVDCDGACGVHVKYEPVEFDPFFEYEMIQIEEILMYHEESGVWVEDVVEEYIWNYPDLDILEVYTNTPCNYLVTFTDQAGDALQINTTTVSPGLCVIENIDKLDPPRHIIIRSRANTSSS